MIAHFKALLKKDWYRAVLSVAIGFLLPEYFAVLSLIPALIFLIRAARRENKSVKIGNLGICLLVYIATMYISIAVSLHPIHSLLMSLLWTVLLIAYFLVTTVLNDRDRIRVTFKTFIASLAVCGVVSMAQYLLRGILGIKDVPLEFWYTLDKWVFSYIPMELVLGWTGIRTASVFNNPNLYGQFSVMLFPFAIYIGTIAKKKAEKWLFWILCAICLVGVAFTFSRGSYLGLILITLLFLVLSLAKSKTARYLAVVVAFGAILLVLIPNPFMDRLQTINPENVSSNIRLKAWDATWEAITQRPILGYGAGTLNAMDIIKAAGIKRTPHAHNTVLELLIEGGILSILPFVCMCITFIKDHLHIRQFENRRDCLLSIAFLSMFGGFILNMMVDYPFSVPKLSIMFMMLLAFSDTHVDLCGVRTLKKVSLRKGK